MPLPEAKTGSSDGSGSLVSALLSASRTACFTPSLLRVAPVMTSTSGLFASTIASNRDATFFDSQKLCFS